MITFRSFFLAAMTGESAEAGALVESRVITGTVPMITKEEPGWTREQSGRWKTWCGWAR